MSIVRNLLNHKYRLSFYSVTRNKHNDTTRTLVYDNVRCRWEEENNIVTSSDGQEVVSRINVWILPDYDILEDYEVIMNSKVYRIASVSPKYSISGQKDHIRIYLR